jgi:hypothetical protein
MAEYQLIVDDRDVCTGRSARRNPYLGKKVSKPSSWGATSMWPDKSALMFTISGKPVHGDEFMTDFPNHHGILVLMFKEDPDRLRVEPTADLDQNSRSPVSVGAGEILDIKVGKAKGLEYPVYFDQAEVDYMLWDDLKTLVNNGEAIPTLTQPFEVGGDNYVPNGLDRLVMFVQ